MSLADDFYRRLQKKLTRASVQTCSRWAETYRVMKDGPLKLDRYPWTRDMRDSTAEFNVACKGAQLGITEVALDVGFFTNDILGEDVLYVLPNQNPDASNFSAARFDAALDLSPYLAELYGDVKNVGHKRAGRANFYIRGSQSRAGLKSVPVSRLILDELEEMDQENVPLALERTSGQMTRLVWAVSTPKLTNSGIDKLFKESSQEHFFFQCPLCSKWTELTFPECIEIVGDDPDSKQVLHDSYLKCRECSGKLHHETKVDWLKTGKWIPGVTGKESRGFHINQLYSTTIRPGHIAASYLRSLTSPADEQEFYNSKLGLPHEVEGAKITDAMLHEVTGAHENGCEARTNKITTMGVDVGKRNHYWVDEWTLGKTNWNDTNSDARCRTLEVGAVHHFEELDDLMAKHGINMCVIDANPERRMAFRFSQRFPGFVKMCFYGRGVSGKSIHEQKSDEGEPLITVDRTSWLDQSLLRVKNKTIDLPRIIPHECREHLKNIVRVPGRDSDGNPIAYYKTPDSKEDHYAHARNYSEIAFALAVKQHSYEDIGRVL